MYVLYIYIYIYNEMLLVKNSVEFFYNCKYFRLILQFLRTVTNVN